MNKNELVQRIIRLAESNHSSTFFINGSPGSGKSYLLDELAHQLPLDITRSFVLGPYLISRDNRAHLGNLIIRDCYEASYLDELYPVDRSEDLVNIWQWFDKHSNISVTHNFLVIVDLGEIAGEGLVDICRLFSNVRYLEGIWDSSDIRIHHIFGGFWDHPGMESYFTEINTSFPYTVSHNYAVWNGVSLADIATLMDEHVTADSRIPYSQILYELTGGHPGIAIDILNLLPREDISISALFGAARKAAAEGQTSQRIVSICSQLPVECKQILKEMINQRKISSFTLSPIMEYLYIAGIIQQNKIGDRRYLDFRSWYIELVIRLHADDLGIEDEQNRKIDIDELIPNTSTIYEVSYRLINETENLARNFITAQLGMRADPNFHYLMGRDWTEDAKTRAKKDAFLRAEEWRHRSEEWGMPTELNPLITYLSTRELANLIEELGAELKSSEWIRIAQSIRRLSDVRDAVMHNQLIDDAGLLLLYDLQADIYEALSKGGMKAELDV